MEHKVLPLPTGMPDGIPTPHARRRFAAVHQDTPPLADLLCDALAQQTEPGAVKVALQALHQELAARANDYEREYSLDLLIEPTQLGLPAPAAADFRDREINKDRFKLRAAHTAAAFVAELVQLADRLEAWHTAEFEQHWTRPIASTEAVSRAVWDAATEPR